MATKMLHGGAGVYGYQTTSHHLSEPIELPSPYGMPHFYVEYDYNGLAPKLYLRRDGTGLSSILTDGMFHSYDAAVDAVIKYCDDDGTAYPSWLNVNDDDDDDATVKLVSSEVMQF